MRQILGARLADKGGGGGLSTPNQVVMGGRIPGKGMRRDGELSLEDQGMKAAGRIREMLKGLNTH